MGGILPRSITRGRILHDYELADALDERNRKVLRRIDLNPAGNRGLLKLLCDSVDETAFTSKLLIQLVDEELDHLRLAIPRSADEKYPSRRRFTIGNVGRGFDQFLDERSSNRSP